MLRITGSQSVQAAENYFRDALLKGDYYFQGQEIAGAWDGKGAERLGIAGELEREQFIGLLHNRFEGERLTPRDAPNRRPGYDFTFDVPKSVSVLYAASEDKRLIEAVRVASRETMQEIEKDMHARETSQAQLRHAHLTPLQNQHFFDAQAPDAMALKSNPSCIPLQNLRSQNSLTKADGKSAHAMPPRF